MSIRDIRQNNQVEQGKPEVRSPMYMQKTNIWVKIQSTPPNEGFGLWKEYENEWFREFNKLTNAGYCLYFISHSEAKELQDPITGEKYEQMTPVGDKRTIKLIQDIVDVIGYVRSNGLDENNNEIPSSLYLGNDRGFKAGSRFDYLVPYIKEFTAQNLIKAIEDAVIAEEKASGIEGKTFSEKHKASEVEKPTFEALCNDIKKYAQVFTKAGEKPKQAYVDIVEEHLGTGKKVSEATEKQYPQIEMILFDLQEFAKDNDIKVKAK